MSEQQDNPIHGKGAEMLPQKGSPFENATPVNEQSNENAQKWEMERARDLAAGEGGISSRRVPNAVTDAQDQTLTPPADKSPARPPNSGFVDKLLESEEIPSAWLSIDAQDTVSERNLQAAQRGKRLKLSEQAEDAIWKITDLIDDLKIAKELLRDVHKAKIYLQSSDEMDANEADKILHEVEYRITLHERTRGWSKKEGRRVILYEITWLIVATALFFLTPLMSLLPETENIINAALAGSLGGVFSALNSLRHHIAIKQDYNPKHNFWFFVQPLLGLPIGSTIYLLITSIFEVWQIADPGFTNSPLIFILSAIAGAQQNILYRLFWGSSERTKL